MKVAATSWNYYKADFANPRFLRQQSMRHSDELSPWIIAIAWISALGIGSMSLIGVLASLRWLFQ